MTPSLRLDGVSAGYGDRLVLNGLSLDVEGGTLTALLGPSGCGKTTVLNVVAGLLDVRAGQIRLGDQPLTGVAAERRGIGMVFQKPLLFPHLTVAENLAFGLEMRGVDPGRRREAVDGALRLVQLEGFGDRRPQALSGGQEQRVAVARALVTEPRVLLLDEPLSALDEGMRGEMRTLIRSLQQRLGVTTLFVTHDQREAVEIADQVALLLDGQVAQHAPPQAFYTDPRAVGVARFFGWCVLPGTEHGQTMAFHPTSARLVTDAPADAGVVSVPVSVERVIDLGAQFHCRVRLPTGDDADLVVSRRPGTGAGFPAGGAAHLEVTAADVRFFRDGERVG